MTSVGPGGVNKDVKLGLCLPLIFVDKSFLNNIDEA